jgi:nicotinamide mononucleotide adenylyltransferase
MSKFELDSLNESKLLEAEDNGVMYAGAFDNPRKVKVDHVEANGIKVLFAGAFKPPHKGHLEVIKNFIKLPQINNKNFTTEKIIVFMGNKPRYSKTNQEFSLEQSIKLFKLYIKAANLENKIELRTTGRDNPVKDVYDYIANSNNDPDKAQPGDVILLGVSQKDKGYYSNLAKFVKDKPWQVIFGEDYQIPMVFKDKEKNEQDLLSEFSSSEFRNAISENNIQMVDSYLPEEILSSEDYKNKAYKILGIQKELGELKESSIIQLINKQLQTPVKSNKLNLGDLISRVNSIYNK